jgi:hypothetical protein
MPIASWAKRKIMFYKVLACIQKKDKVKFLCSLELFLYTSTHNERSSELTVVFLRFVTQDCWDMQFKWCKNQVQCVKEGDGGPWVEAKSTSSSNSSSSSGLSCNLTTTLYPVGHCLTDVYRPQTIKELIKRHTKAQQRSCHNLLLHWGEFFLPQVKLWCNPRVWKLHWFC